MFLRGLMIERLIWSNSVVDLFVLPERDPERTHARLSIGALVTLFVKRAPMSLDGAVGMCCQLHPIPTIREQFAFSTLTIRLWPRVGRVAGNTPWSSD